MLARSAPVRMARGRGGRPARRGAARAAAAGGAGGTPAAPAPGGGLASALRPALPLKRLSLAFASDVPLARGFAFNSVAAYTAAVALVLTPSMCVVPFQLAAANAALHAQLRLLGALLLPAAATFAGLADAAANDRLSSATYAHLNAAVFVAGLAWMYLLCGLIKLSADAFLGPPVVPLVAAMLPLVCAAKVAGTSGQLFADIKGAGSGLWRLAIGDDSKPACRALSIAASFMLLAGFATLVASGATMRAGVTDLWFSTSAVDPAQVNFVAQRFTSVPLILGAIVGAALKSAAERGRLSAGTFVMLAQAYLACGVIGVATSAQTAITAAAAGTWLPVVALVGWAAMATAGGLCLAAPKASS